METVPCVRAENLTDKQIRELRILDNKLNESDWDIDLLKEDLDDLDFDDFDIDFGLDEDDEEFEKEREDKPLIESISVVIDCINELDAERVFEKLKEEGYNCRISTL